METLKSKPCEKTALSSEILENIPAMIYIFEYKNREDPASLHNIWSSKAANCFTGYSRKEIDLLGSLFFEDVLHPDDLPGIYSLGLSFNLCPAALTNHLYRLRYKKSDEYCWFVGNTVALTYYDTGQPKRLLHIAVEFIDQHLTRLPLTEIIESHNRQHNKPKLQTLTMRQKEIASLIARGYKDKEIAERLFISIATAKTHRNVVIKKLQLKNSAALAAFAAECGL